MCTNTCFVFAALVIVTATFTGCVSYTHIHPPPPPPERDEIVGTWLGFKSYSAYRLDLFADGTGALATTSSMEMGIVDRYETDQWTLDGTYLSATFHPVNSSKDTVYFQAWVARKDALRDISISLSSQVPVFVAEEFTRNTRVDKWLDLLTPPESVSKK